MKDICRLCMKGGNLENIFHSNNFAEKIMLCASVSVIENDGLPQKICKDCINELDICIKFKQTCERSDRTLRLSLCLNQYEKQLFLKEEKNDIIPSSKITTEDSKENTINLANALSPSYSEPISIVDNESNATNSTKKISSDTEEQINSSQNLDGLEQLFHLEKYFNCDLCNRKFFGKAELDIHVRNKHKKSYRCKFCNRDFLSEKYLKVHYLNKHERDTGKKTSKKALRKITRPTKDISCKTCYKKFASNATLLLHQENHLRNSFLYTSKDHLLKSKPRRNKRLLQLEDCAKSAIEDISEPKEYQGIHSPNVFACAKCGKKFRSLSTKQCHERKC